MHLPQKRRRWGLAGGAAVIAAGLAATIGTAIAIASTSTLRVLKNVHDDNATYAQFAVKAENKTEAVAVGPAGHAVYTFQGETTHHIICKKTSNAATNCWGFWPPVSVASKKGLSKQTGISGKLGTFRNHGTLQVTLNGQPLYYFMPDLMSGNKHLAQGDELKTFGSTWHLVTPHSAGAVQHAARRSSSGSSSSGGSGGW